MECYSNVRWPLKRSVNTTFNNAEARGRVPLILMKYIIVTGGVLSGLGKGISASSIGLLLKHCGYSVTVIKIDPYLNCDAGTMNPFEHGEVFVLSDGGEVDLDLGNYERFLGIELSRDHNITTGKVYRKVIERERRGDFLGKTVQIIPHITNEIRETIVNVGESSNSDICLVEMGGTVGDIESMPFLEAARQLRSLKGRDDVVVVHTTLVPVMGVVGEQKTKPTQHSVKTLMGLGILPDIIVCRSDEPLAKSTKAKISLFCDIPEDAIVGAHDVQNVYQVPLLFHKQGLTTYILTRLGLEVREPKLEPWIKFVERVVNPKGLLKIAIVGKYTGLRDSYLSLIKSLDHAGAEVGMKVKILWIESEDKEPEMMFEQLAKADGMIIPGGFGVRGIEGKIEAARYARENGLPFLGICLGLQIAVIEFSRNVLGLEGANSTEFDPDAPHPVVTILPEQLKIEEMGGTMRLGSQETIVKPDTKAFSLYDSESIWERHRHRYEIEPDYIERIEQGGFKFSGHSVDGRKMEIGELPSHPFLIGCQFHPEFLSRPGKPAPLFMGLVKAAVEFQNKRS